MISVNRKLYEGLVAIEESSKTNNRVIKIGELSKILSIGFDWDLFKSSAAIF